jgi:hypothetical protein
MRDYVFFNVNAHSASQAESACSTPVTGASNLIDWNYCLIRPQLIQRVSDDWSMAIYILSSE